MEAEKLTKLFQMVGAALALPAAAAGAYTVYRSHFSPDVACQNLRATIVSTMEKNVGAEAKRALLRKDVAEFERACGTIDPEARAFFQAALDADNARAGSNPVDARPAVQKAPEARLVDARQGGSDSPPPQVAAPPASATVVPSVAPDRLPMTGTPPSAAPANQAPPAVAAPASPPVPTPPASVSPPVIAAAPPVVAPAVLPRPVAPAPSAAVVPAQAPPRSQPGIPPSPPAKMAARDAKPAAAAGERRGWVTLAVRLGPRRGEINFDGYPIRPGNPPPPGTTLTARWAVPVWNDAADSGRDIAAAQMVLKTGSCVRVLATRPGVDRILAEVVTAKCGP